MMVDFNSFPENERYYSGNAGAKMGIFFQDENWFLKFGKSTRGFRNMDISYATSPLSEYIGSHIYEIIGVPVHKTLLGERDGKIVVACQDFRKQGDELIEFKNIKNAYVKGRDEISSGATYGDSVDLEDVLQTIRNNKTLQMIPGVEERFWDMFVVDALISNNDRNNGNWGILVHPDGSKELTPVYDNGNCLTNKKSNDQILKTLQNPEAMKDASYRLVFCTYSDKEKLINPMEYISNTPEAGCLDAIHRIVPRIDLSRINRMIDEIPEEYHGLEVMSPVRRQFYKELLQIRHEEVFLPVLEKSRVIDQSKETPARRKRQLKL